MAQIERKIIITYRWWITYNKDESISLQHTEILESSAIKHINEMIDQGFSSGDLNEEIHVMNYSGWWEVTTDC